MSFHPQDPVISLQSPLKGTYPMTVRTVCVAPGQMLREGDRIAELLEPSGRWVCIVATEVAGQIKAVRIRVGDQLTAPAEIAAIFIAKRPRPDDPPLTGAVHRVPLEVLQAEAATDPATPQRAPIHPNRLMSRGGFDPPRAAGAGAGAGAEGIFQQFLQHKRLIIACTGAILLAFGSAFGTGLFTQTSAQPEVSMDQLWSEMRAARSAAAEAENAQEGDDLSTRAADQNRALAQARDAPLQTGACAGFFVGMQLPGQHITRGVRRVTYLDPDRGVGAYLWTKSQVPSTFSCAHERP